MIGLVALQDIVDKELGALRKKRWEKAFNKDGNEHFDEEARDEVNRKATIVIEVSKQESHCENPINVLGRTTNVISLKFLLSSPCSTATAFNPSCGRSPHHAALARLFEMERTLLSRMLPSVS